MKRLSAFVIAIALCASSADAATVIQRFPAASSSSASSQTSTNVAAVTPGTRTNAVTIKAGARALWVGDSLTKGYNGSDNPAYRWQLPLEGYITQDFTEAGQTPPTIIPTTAVSGQTSLDLLNGVAAQITSQTPDVVIMLIGTNDTVRSTGGGGGPPLTPAQTQANITGIIAAGLASNAAMKFIIVSPLFQTGEDWPIGANVTNGGDAAMSGVRSAEQAACAAAGTSVCQFIDISQAAFAWEAQNNTAHATSGLLTQEGTHPTAPLGQTIWSASVYQQISLATRQPMYPAWKPIGGRRVTAPSAQQTLDIQNWAGGVSGGVRINGEIQLGTGGDDDVILQLNGVTSGYTTTVFGIQGSGTAGFNSVTGDFGGGANTAGVAMCRGGGTSARALCSYTCLITPTDGNNNYFVNCTSQAGNATTGAAFQAFMTTATVVPSSPGTPLTRITTTTKSGNATKIGTNSEMRARRMDWTN